MKNKVLSSLFISFISISLFSCNLNSSDPSGTYVPNIDNNKDLKEYSEEEYKTESETYYKSEYLSFIMEVKGYYQIDIPFYLDKDNENLRIYDDMYFYEGDYFQIMSSDYKYIWATLKDENTKYLTPLREEGLDIQVDVKVSGIYKIVLDIKTMVMDFTYKSEITTPYYYPFKSCEIGTLGDDGLEFVTMEINPSNNDEFMVNDYSVATGKLYSFYSQFTHTSTYKLLVDKNSTRFISALSFDKTFVFNISGKFNIYVNKKTYKVRVTISDPSLVYDCIIYFNKQSIALTPKDEDTPYLFEYNYEATSDVGGYGVMSDDLPAFYNKSYQKYQLDVFETNLLGKYSNGKYYFKKKGLYKLTIDLLNLTLSVEKIEG